jgi:hypothetical protein
MEKKQMIDHTENLQYRSPFDGSKEKNVETCQQVSLQWILGNLRSKRV